LLVTIKPHSSFKQFFSEKEYVADFKTYADIFYYLKGMHKRFIRYVRQQKEQGIEESFVFLDKNLRVINPEELQIKHAREGDIIYIVPAVVGGGGKRGGILGLLLLAAFIFVALPAIGVGSALLSGGASLGSAISGGIGSIGGAGSFAAGIAAVKASPFLTNLVVNVGLSLLSSLFASDPKEEETRQNDMFGSLTNSTDSGTPVALNYGLMRVAGQMVNGYVSNMSHTKTQQMNVYGEIIENENTSASEQQAKRDSFLSGFNSFT
jgi:predicted phage tail protein